MNFTTLAAAIAATDDLLGRLHGRVFGCEVRLGYGKVESVPPTPLETQVANVATPTDSSMPTQSSPTRALWVGSIPPTTTTNDLLNVFASYGPIESARVLSHKSCAFVNMERLDDAVKAKKSLHGQDVFGHETGPVRSMRKDLLVLSRG